MCGVYYLWDGASVLYVGASRNVEQRVCQHRSRIDFCGYFCDECDPHELDELEVAAIKEFAPPYNCIHMTCLV
jgi:predicted GIY-YIG superfamily endonuclease